MAAARDLNQPEMVLPLRALHTLEIAQESLAAGAREVFPDHDSNELHSVAAAGKS